MARAIDRVPFFIFLHVPHGTPCICLNSTVDKTPLCSKSLLRPIAVGSAMKSRRGTSFLNSVAWNAFSGILILPPFLTATYAASGLSLVPNPPKACEVLAIQWPGNEAATPVNLTIVEESGQTVATLFETTVDAPTQSVEWQVFATEGILLQIAVFTGGDAGAPPYQATDVAVQSGACDPPVDPSSSSPSPSPTESSNSGFTSLQGSQTSSAVPSSQTPPPHSLSPSMPTTTATQSITPRTTPASPTGQSGLTASAAVGIATGVSASVVCLALASVSYIKRRRSRALTARADPFIAGHRPRSSTSRIRASSSDDARDTHQGGPEMCQQVDTRPDSSLVARASSMDSCAPDRFPYLSHLRRENIDVLLMSEKLSRDRRNRTAPTPTMDGASRRTDTAVKVAVVVRGHGIEHPRGPQQETDGGVRLAGGRARESVADEFDEHSAFQDGSTGTLPPPYSSHF